MDHISLFVGLIRFNNCCILVNKTLILIFSISLVSLKINYLLTILSRELLYKYL